MGVTRAEPGQPTLRACLKSQCVTHPVFVFLLHFALASVPSQGTHESCTSRVPALCGFCPSPKDTSCMGTLTSVRFELLVPGTQGRAWHPLGAWYVLVA